MKTGFYELDDIIDLNKQQLIVCSSVDNVIEAFLINIFKNIVIDQKRAALYIDNCLVKDDCSDIIKKEREMLFENKKYEMELIPEFIDIADNILDDIIANITMVDRLKLFNNRIVEKILNEQEIRNLKEDNKIKLMEIINRKKYIITIELLSEEEKNKIKKAESIIKTAHLILRHIEKLTMRELKKMCYECKTKYKIEIIILNNINIIKHQEEIKILNELQRLSQELNITIIVGYNIIIKDIISIEHELNDIKNKCNYIDTILFLKKEIEEIKDILHIWTIKNINKKLGKIDLLYLDEFKKCINLKNYN